ncbi:MAG: YeeE/YedE family protein [Desulfobacterales bacterium]|nr:YeeE/YedE family protein [Pseudomonadota bacterium]MBU4354771.1 YeeE/YedE family protein [Pseudomonadota bacterium]MCG2770586.1 YeeE/YedE family protein [Desulfobacterales bacterium]
MNPYLAGIFLGLVLLASFLILGAGLGASGGVARLGAALEATLAPQHTQASAYFGPWGPNYLSYYLVFMLLGTFLGGLISAVTAKRIQPTVERGQACGVKKRVIYALVGGLLVGFASRLAQGCTSGQALTGGAMLLSGSLVFMGTLFASGYAAARFFRGQWHD